MPTIQVSTQSQLSSAFIAAQSSPGTVIEIDDDIVLTSFVNVLSSNTGLVIDAVTDLVINGNGHSISGQGNIRCVYIGSTASTSVTFNDLTISNGVSAVNSFDHN